MTWEEICNSKSFRDLPYKIETNEHQQIVMSPTSIRHFRFQGRIMKLLFQITKDGEVLPEASIETDQGVKVADVVWASGKFLEQFSEEFAFPISPELCIEVLSRSNTTEEMEGKRALYFAQGAKEVWICDLNGKMTFYNTDKTLAQSLLFPEFPKEI